MGVMRRLKDAAETAIKAMGQRRDERPAPRPSTTGYALMGPAGEAMAGLVKLRATERIKDPAEWERAMRAELAPRDAARRAVPGTAKTAAAHQPHRHARQDPGRGRRRAPRRLRPRRAARPRLRPLPRARPHPPVRRARGPAGGRVGHRARGDRAAPARRRPRRRLLRRRGDLGRRAGSASRRSSTRTSRSPTSRRRASARSRRSASPATSRSTRAAATARPPTRA